jgi:3-isopropylmalate/(R)-2-methylmalate dehydratase small subunit
MWPPLRRLRVRSSIRRGFEETSVMYEGTVRLLGDNVDTDVMIAGRYLSLQDPTEMAQHIFEETDPGFRTRVQSGDILVAGTNFGSGSAREHAPLGFKALGISCIVATSFSRTFYRMCVDLGLPPITSREAFAIAKEGQRGRVDPARGEVWLGEARVSADPLPDFILELARLDGLTNWVRERLRAEQQAA